MVCQNVLRYFVTGASKVSRSMHCQNINLDGGEQESCWERRWVYVVGGYGGDTDEVHLWL